MRFIISLETSSISECKILFNNQPNNFYFLYLEKVLKFIAGLLIFNNKFVSFHSSKKINDVCVFRIDVIPTCSKYLENMFFKFNLLPNSRFGSMVHS